MFRFTRLKAHQPARTFLLAAVALLTGCGASRPGDHPTIVLDHLPPAGAGGSEAFEAISGKVIGAEAGQQIVIYSHSGAWWWVQPFRSRPFTAVAADGSWKTPTHIGNDYAALLVDPKFQPPVKLAAPPTVGNGVLAVTTMRGSSSAPRAPKLLRFSGYDWKVRTAPVDHNGEPTEYEPANAWVDGNGHLHLLMGQADGHWRCAGVSLTRSLGYGTYRFVVQDSAMLPPSAVLAMFTRDDREEQDSHTGLDVELSQWGKPKGRNADYVVQPYYIPENTTHFTVPPGPVTYVVNWEPGSATFRALAGVTATSHGRQMMERVFKSGIPIPAAEKVHLDLYDFFHSQSGLQHPVEVVIERFEYLP
ncbi:hypothetical protein SAMN05421819_0289 [Bryocella elongata]|uniref:GH16 domain-containing protein n=1 Tax=Bryocella elongata TaxID=863522 RepID=A0A1H5SNF5_9BACT|nr:glycoside hydrolase family 16 protein [Bryocella elongata]SEF52152.1 hypothetical protein SAMN05421819_0289 [Bryocella elongata]